MLLMIDNYDSFTFNLVHYFESLGQDVLTLRNDEVSLSQIKQLKPDYIVISPGPCDPQSAGLSLAIIEQFKGKIPILGVCLGHQCIAEHFGGKVLRARQVMHGKTSFIRHTQSGLFSALPEPLEVTRYHSLIADKTTLPDCLKVTAWTELDNGDVDEIMAFEHNELPIMGVQFHPESVLTQSGHALLNNFLTLTG